MTFHIEIMTGGRTVTAEAESIQKAENIAVLALRDNGANGARIYRTSDKRLVKEYYFADGRTDELHVHMVLHWTPLT